MTGPSAPGPTAGCSGEGSALEEAAARLREERSALRARVSQLTDDMAGFFEASRNSNADDEHDAEGQTIAYARAQLSAVTDQARASLQEVEAALARVGDGTYGVCEVCGRPVSAARLQARPTARTCVDHAPPRDRYRRQV